MKKHPKCNVKELKANCFDRNKQESKQKAGFYYPGAEMDSKKKKFVQIKLFVTECDMLPYSFISVLSFTSNFISVVIHVVDRQKFNILSMFCTIDTVTICTIDTIPSEKMAKCSA